MRAMYVLYGGMRTKSIVLFKTILEQKQTKHTIGTNNHSRWIDDEPESKGMPFISFIALDQKWKWHNGHCECFLFIEMGTAK